MTQTPLRILLSPPVRQQLANPIAQVMGKSAFELVCTGDEGNGAQPGVDIALLSRDVTGLSTKHELTQGLLDFYAVLRRSANLKWVHSHSAGADRPIYPELRLRGVHVTTSSGANAEVVAQTAMAGLLALARRFPQLIAAQQARRWAPLVSAAVAPRDLAGQTAVIVGWGPIGQRIAVFLRLLGLHVVVARHSSAPAPESGVEMVRLADLSAVLPRADWVVLACPLTAQTRGLLDGRMLNLLPPSACLINVARGEVVVQADVISALQAGRLDGAYLDVFEHEPLDSTSPLWDLPNVIVTPHSAGHSDGHHKRVCEMFLANLARWHDGQPLQQSIA